MWLFTKYGFFSVVCAYGNRGEPDKKWVMVRARLRRHLTALQRRFKNLQRYEIIDTDDTDYRWRLIVTKRLAKKIINELTHEINWTNFKDECHKAKDPHYDTSLFQVWSIMNNLQGRRNFGNPGLFPENFLAK